MIIKTTAVPEERWRIDLNDSLSPLRNFKQIDSFDPTNVQITNLGVVGNIPASEWIDKASYVNGIPLDITCLDAIRRQSYPIPNNWKATQSHPIMLVFAGRLIMKKESVARKVIEQQTFTDRQGKKSTRPVESTVMVPESFPFVPILMWIPSNNPLYPSSSLFFAGNGRGYLDQNCFLPILV